MVQGMLDFLNSNFSTAFFGAIAGSFSILAVEWYRGHRRVLADVNASIGVLQGLLNTYLNLKRQHSMPILRQYKDDCEKHQAILDLERSGVRPNPPLVIRYNVDLKKFYSAPIHFDVPLDRIFALTENNPAVVQIVLQAKKSAFEVETACAMWNQLMDQMQTLADDERGQFYFGIRLFNGVKNELFTDTVKILALSVDDALFFTKRAIEEVTKTGRLHLKFGLSKKIAKVEIVDDEHKALMPPDDYKKGW